MNDDCCEYESIDDVEFPVEFRMPCHGERRSSTMLYENGLPEDDDLMDSLRHYPGEVIIHGEIDESVGGYSFTPTELEFGGTTFTPEDND